MNKTHTLALTLLIANMELTHCTVNDIKATMRKNPAYAFKKYEKEMGSLDSESQKELWELAADLLGEARTEQEVDALHNIKDACSPYAASDNLEEQTTTPAIILAPTPTPAPTAHKVDGDPQEPQGPISAPTAKPAKRQILFDLYGLLRQIRTNQIKTVNRASQECEKFELDYY